MRLHEHFLPGDLEKASKEYHCIRDLLIDINLELKKGNSERAKQLSIELTRSLHELTRLAEKKSDLDRISTYMEQLGAAGINIQVVRKLKHG